MDNSIHPNPKIICIIPARGGSKGIPLKNIIPVRGKPLLAWTIEQALRASLIDRTFVSTDDNQIEEIALKYDSEVIKRPGSLATDYSTTDEVIIHALNHVNVEFGLIPDLVVILQATSPLRKPEDIDNAIKTFIFNKLDSLFSATHAEDITLWEECDGTWKSLNFDFTNRERRQDRKKQFIENGSIYICKSKEFLQKEKILNGTIGIYLMDFWQTWEIDTAEEIDLIEFYLQKYLIKNSISHLKQTKIELIVFDFDGVFTDNKAFLSENGSEGVVVNRADGVGIDGIRKLKIPMLILSSESNLVVEKRAQKLRIPVIQNVTDKKEALTQYTKEKKIPLKNVIYVGNDINDLEVMKTVGVPICPADSNNKIKEISRVVLCSKGGEGVARELYELLF